MTEEEFNQRFDERLLKMLGDYSNMPLSVENAIRERIRQPIIVSKYIDFGSVADNGNETQTIDVQGAEVSDPVALGLPTAAEAGGVSYTTRVSSSGVVAIRLSNESGGAFDAAAGIFRVAVFKQ